LRVHLTLIVVPAVTSITQQPTIAQDTLTTFILQSVNLLTTTTRFLHFGIVDNQTATNILFYLNTTATDSTTNSTLDLVLDLPHFNESFSYDPDFSLVLGTSSLDCGDGGSGGTLLPLLSLLVLLVPITFFMVGAGLLTYVLIRRWQLRAKVTGMAERVL